MALALARNHRRFNEQVEQAVFDLADIALAEAAEDLAASVISRQPLAARVDHQLKQQRHLLLVDGEENVKQQLHYGLSQFRYVHRVHSLVSGELRPEKGIERAREISVWKFCGKLGGSSRLIGARAGTIESARSDLPEQIAIAAGVAVKRCQKMLTGGQVNRIGKRKAVHTAVSKLRQVVERERSEAHFAGESVIIVVATIERNLAQRQVVIGGAAFLHGEIHPLETHPAGGFQRVQEDGASGERIKSDGGLGRARIGQMPKLYRQQRNRLPGLVADVPFEELETLSGAKVVFFGNPEQETYECTAILGKTAIDALKTRRDAGTVGTLMTEAGYSCSARIVSLTEIEEMGVDLFRANIVFKKVS